MADDKRLQGYASQQHHPHYQCRHMGFNLLGNHKNPSRTDLGLFQKRVAEPLLRRYYYPNLLDNSAKALCRGFLQRLDYASLPRGQKVHTAFKGPRRTYIKCLLVYPDERICIYNFRRLYGGKMRALAGDVYVHFIPAGYDTKQEHGDGQDEDENGREKGHFKSCWLFYVENGSLHRSNYNINNISNPNGFQIHTPNLVCRGSAVHYYDFYLGYEPRRTG